jgi:hypothetical protein
VKRLLWVLGGLAVIGWQVFAANQWGAEAVQERMYVATALVSAVFIVLYSRDPWHRSWFGRSLMALAVSLLLVGVSVILYRAFGPDYPLRSVLIIATVDIANFAIVTRVLVLIGAQRKDEHKADPRR